MFEINTIKGYSIYWADKIVGLIVKRISNFYETSQYSIHEEIAEFIFAVGFRSRIGLQMRFVCCTIRYRKYAKVRMGLNLSFSIQQFWLNRARLSTVSRRRRKCSAKHEWIISYEFPQSYSLKFLHNHIHNWRTNFCSLAYYTRKRKGEDFTT